MEKIELTCGACPNACRLVAEYEDDEVLDVTGNNCMKGFIYAQQEVVKLNSSQEP